MMPELGRYAISVLGSYGSTIVLVSALIIVTVLRGRASKKTLAALELKHKGKR
ncbi:MAG: heme exporter protein CcmD [Rhodobacteraceae bacterium]|nr:heme exporter protein CcmD [Paracoccaceae bacterium]